VLHRTPHKICQWYSILQQSFVNTQVLRSDVEAQQNVVPFLRHRLLRQIVKSFTNSPNDDFQAWAKNQQAIDTLKEAQRLLDNGYISEEDMEHSLLAHLQVSRSEYHSPAGQMYLLAHGDAHALLLIFNCVLCL